MRLSERSTQPTWVIVSVESVKDTHLISFFLDSGRVAMLGKRREIVLDEASKFLGSLGVEEVPRLSARFLSQLGLGEEKKRGFGEKTRWNDRPRRSFDRNDSPRRSFDKNDGFRRSFEKNDRPRRSFGKPDQFE